MDMIRTTGFFSDHWTVKSMKMIFWMNIVFWTGISLGALYNYVVNQKGYVSVLILFVVELALYSGAYLLMNKKKRIGYYFLLLMAFGTTMLSIVDEVGIADLLSLAVSLLLFISLLKIWGRYHRYLKE